ncbi:MAG: HDOD domain-containing protein [Sterolibacterium sp.]|jgi:HD-like signal output (HDOD) protein|nr:HDOD domain-containing protein [Sterolibacterium sp.]
MSIEISAEDAEKALKGVNIPPRPAVLNEINAELQKDNPDVGKLASRIASDVALSAAILKVVNSPYFGLRSKVASVPAAVQLMGMRNVKSIVTGLLLKTTLSGGAVSLERFWDSAEKVAKISSFIATRLPRGPRDEAYTMGLFRECGIPLLMQRFPDYKETLKVAGGDPRPMTAVEEERHGTNHAVIGYMVAKTWGLPEVLSEALQRHHDASVFDEGDSASAGVRTLVAINYLAEYLNDTSMRMRDNPQWNSVAEQVLDHLGFNSGEFEELREDVVPLLQ